MYKPKTWVIQIKVTDTGSGIEPALQEKVFEPFVQGDQTLSRSYGGTGLGLSICRQLSKMMRGSLTLDSTIGEGSSFTLTLPLPQTGEIVVPPQDLEMFCDDEFNPTAKSNRKVAFDEKAIVVHDDVNDTTMTLESINKTIVQAVTQQWAKGHHRLLKVRHPIHQLRRIMMYNEKQFMTVMTVMRKIHQFCS